MKLLFLGSLLPPVVLAIVLIVRIAVEQMGLDLDWDPVLLTIQIQAFPVALLALALGTPSVARDRSEDVLFLYATRPVTPWSYALGKMLAVAITAAALLIVPAVLLAILRQGVLGDRVSTPDSMLIIGKVAMAAIVMAWGYAGVAVGPSAITKRGRWALLLAIGVFLVPDAITEIFNDIPDAIGPAEAVKAVLDALFTGDEIGTGIFGAGMLVAYGLAGRAHHPDTGRQGDDAMTTGDAAPDGCDVGGDPPARDPRGDARHLGRSHRRHRRRERLLRGGRRTQSRDAGSAPGNHRLSSAPTAAERRRSCARSRASSFRRRAPSRCSGSHPSGARRCAPR